MFRTKSRFAWSCLTAFLVSWGIQIAAGMTVRNFLLLPVFLVLWRFFWLLLSRQEAAAARPLQNPDPGATASSAGAAGTGAAPQVHRNQSIGKHSFFWPVLAALLLSLSFLLAQHAQYTAAFSSRLFQAGALLVVLLGLFLLFLALLVWLDDFLLQSPRQNRFFATRPIRHLLYTHAPLCTFLACLLCWLPYYLYEFPGILSPDGAWQAEQAIGVRPWSNHHPVAHSVIIWFFYHIGRLFTDNVNLALGFYTLAQLIFMAGCAAIAVRALQKLSMAGWILALAAAFYALVPFNGVFSVMVGKDTVFSGVTLLLCCSLLSLLQDKTTIPIRHRVSFVLAGIAFCLFRTNGWYAFLFLTPFLLICLRRTWKPVLAMLVLIVAAAGVIRGPVMDAAGVEKNDFVESICVPLQQVGLVAVEDQNGGQAIISDEQRSLIGKVCHYEDIPKVYDPEFADMMKELIRTNGDQQYLTEHKGEFLKLWLDLGVRNPGLYLQAWIDVTKGYWFPDESYETATIDGVFSNLAGLSWQPLIGGRFVVKAKEIFLKLGTVVPVYGLLFSSGTYWFLLVCTGALLLRRGRNRRYVLILLPCLALFLTLFLAAPIFAEFRYTYPVALTFPLWIVLPRAAAILASNSSLVISSSEG